MCVRITEQFVTQQFIDPFAHREFKFLPFIKKKKKAKSTKLPFSHIHTISPSTQNHTDLQSFTSVHVKCVCCLSCLKKQKQAAQDPERVQHYHLSLQSTFTLRHIRVVSPIQTSDTSIPCCFYHSYLDLRYLSPRSDSGCFVATSVPFLHAFKIIQGFHLSILLKQNVSADFPL